jgi:hypothetical protein
VVVIGTRGGQVRSRRRFRRRARAARPEPPPTELPVTIATVVDTEPLENVEAARAWLAAERRSGGEEALQTGLDTLNHVLQAHRIAVADPAVHEVSLDQAAVARVGFGAGEYVALGRWTSAFEAPRAPRGRQRRSAALRPQERLGALLGARDPALAAEEMVLRARQDVDRKRHREAAMQLSVAYRAALAELPPWIADRPSLKPRLEELERLAPGVHAAAETALAGGLAEEDVKTTVHALERLEAALRARTAPGVGGL